ncbi:MAG: hypothetical protein IJH86_03225 [Clostridia bacterium]|nr:hypothetical protein [Clostridia bacterium]
MFGKRDDTDKVRKKRVELHEVTAENDIRYRGPLSYFHFQILGWLCIVLSQVALFIRLAGRVNPDAAAGAMNALGFLQRVANLSLPFLLISVFAQLLNAEDGYIKQIAKNAAATAGICALFYIAFYRYIVGGIGAFLEDSGEIMPTVQTIIAQTLPGGFVAFNIFVDLFLCALSMFFLNYNPRRVFTGRARILFRLMALIPIGYEVGCMVLKGRSARGLIEIPIWAYPLLTVKPVMTFVLFVALALFVKTRELRFRRHGRTHEEYRAFLKTRRNSWNFSVFLAIMLVVVSLVDFAVVIGFSMGEMVQSAASSVEAKLSATPTPEPSALEAALEAALDAATQGDSFDLEAFLARLPEALPEVAATDATPEAEGEAAATDATPKPIKLDEIDAETLKAAFEDAMQEEEMDLAMNRGVAIARAVGFGGSVYLFFLAPLVLLFSYTRKPKYPWMGMLVPVAGIALILVVYLEGVHRLLYLLPFEKMRLEELKEMAALGATMIQ